MGTSAYTFLTSVIFLFQPYCLRPEYQFVQVVRCQTIYGAVFHNVRWKRVGHPILWDYLLSRDVLLLWFHQVPALRLSPHQVSLQRREQLSSCSYWWRLLGAASLVPMECSVRRKLLDWHFAEGLVVILALDVKAVHLFSCLCTPQQYLCHSHSFSSAGQWSRILDTHLHISEQYCTILLQKKRHFTTVSIPI